MLDKLSQYSIVLGSGSPRRRELFDKLKIPYSIRTSDIEEILPAGYDIMQAATYLAELKANDLKKSMSPSELLITADTVVISDDTILGKPKNQKEAIDTIISLSDKTHLVVTGVCISTSSRSTSFDDVTEVTFAKVTPDEAKWYVANHQVLDKAGSYGIQDWIGLTKVTHIVGSYYNIMGLPVHRLYDHLLNF